ncbi:MAG: NADH-quinone oxidoreductase subunit NuoE, partial [Paracoccaceae bacterium]
SFTFTPANQVWAEAQITKFPEGRQASAVIPILWRAQQQEGWLTRPAIEHVADMLGMANIRALEVATFYFMFQLQPVGSVAHIQICGTTSCMICGSGDLIEVCRDKIAPQAHQLSGDGRFSWEEVECLGACSNAPMAQIGKDYYEDLTGDKLAGIIAALGAGEVPTPGPQNGRYAAEPLAGLTSLTGYESGRTQFNASVQLADDLGDTVKRIDGSETELVTPGLGKTAKKPAKKPPMSTARPQTGAAKQKKPASRQAPRKAGADDLKLIRGVGVKLEKLLNGLGFFHYDQIAVWSADEIAWVDENLQGFKGRVSRDGWVSQAKTLASGGKTAISGRAKRRAKN